MISVGGRGEILPRFSSLEQSYNHVFPKKMRTKIAEVDARSLQQGMVWIFRRGAEIDTKRKRKRID